MQYWAVSLLFVVIYNTNYITNNYIIFTTGSSPYHHYHSPDINSVLQGLSMHILSVNISALPHWLVGDKQEWSDNKYYTILGIATLTTCDCFFEYFSAFNTTYRYIRQRYKECMMWLLLSDINKIQQDNHCETMEQWDNRLLISVCCAVWKYVQFVGWGCWGAGWREREGFGSEGREGTRQ